MEQKTEFISRDSEDIKRKLDKAEREIKEYQEQLKSKEL